MVEGLIGFVIGWICGGKLMRKWWLESEADKELTNTYFNNILETLYRHACREADRFKWHLNRLNHESVIKKEDDQFYDVWEKQYLERLEKYRNADKRSTSN